MIGKHLSLFHLYYEAAGKGDHLHMSSTKRRYYNISTCFLYGMEGILADIEVAISAGLPNFDIVGLCDPSIRESKERVRAAIRHAGYEFPTGRITVGLSPAYMHKSGSSFDLPLALCVLLASGQIHAAHKGRIFAYGELTLTGMVREVPGSILRLCSTRNTDITHVIIPFQNKKEAELMDIHAYGVSSLANAICIVEGNDAYQILEDNRVQEPLVTISHGKNREIDASTYEPVDFSMLRGQEKTGRALLLAASGFHNILLTGSPGSGKTTAARVLQGILPPLTAEEKLELLKLQSATRVLHEEDLHLDQRPFRYVHHTCTSAAMAGGGANPTPGELSLSLHGVLFLDEMAEFSPRVLDLLRQPMEENSILISRAGMKIRFPTQFLLVGAMNPCRCGKILEDPKACTCNEWQRKQYINHISGPLLDRIDLFSELYRVEKLALMESVQGVNLHASDCMREQVAACWNRQYMRCDESGQVRTLNGLNRTLRIMDSFRISKKAVDFAVQSAERLKITARGLNRMLRVARTVADLDEKSDVLISHVAESIQFRQKSP
jgi:magnesium chelatase family protein